jgi:hypothetical protein
MNVVRIASSFLLFSIISIAYAVTVDLPETVTITSVVLQRTISPVTPPTPSLGPSGGNNGIPLTVEAGTDSAVFSGRAYPGSIISIIKNGLVVNELPANSDGTFEVPVHSILPGTYTFSVRAKDSNGLKSSMVTYTIVIESGTATEIRGIMMPPTITTNKIEVKIGDDIIVSGKAVPYSDVAVTLFAKDGVTRSVVASSSGTWSYTLSTNGLSLGDYNIKAQSKVQSDVSLYSETVLFTVGTSNKIRKMISSLVNARCDLNNDGRVNLLDFSIMAFWYKRLGFPPRIDLNSDSRINLTDLSILAYCWTG